MPWAFSSVMMPPLLESATGGLTSTCSVAPTAIEPASTIAFFYLSLICQPGRSSATSAVLSSVTVSR